MALDVLDVRESSTVLEVYGWVAQVFKVQFANVKFLHSPELC